MNKKYEFTEETMDFMGITLHRIKSVCDFDGVRKGDIGGWIEKELNLSHSLNAWVFGDARISGDARVFGDASISGDAWVSGDARVCDDACVLGKACVFGDAWVSGKARVSGNASVFGDASISGDARVFGKASVFGNARVSGDASVCDDAAVRGLAVVKGNAAISQSVDYICIGPIGSRSDYITFTRSNGCVTAGCFHGPLAEFVKQVKKVHGNNEHARAYLALVEYVKAMWEKIQEVLTR